MPVNPLAAAALVLLCFAIPFGVAALFDDGPDRTPVAVSQPAVQPLDQSGETVRIATLRPVPRLPRLREPPAAETPAPEPGPTATAPAAATPPAAASPAPAPTPAPTPAPAPSGGGGGGGSSGGGSGSGSGSFDSTR